MEVGARVWINDNDGDEAWLLCEVASRTDEELKLFLVSDTSKRFTRLRIKTQVEEGGAQELKYDGVELANNPLSELERTEGKDNDMITLPHLHEPAILHAIGERFDAGKIYTWTGPVLIAVNPFQRLPLYTQNILETYRQDGLLRSQGMGQSTGSKLGPHVYAIADLSYRQMMAAGRKSQSILISGESGAGKTESTKIVMLYLTTLGTAHIGGGEEKSGDLNIMERVLQSNPILEAFGNARTLRNDNSSRFGKFIELGFSRSGSLLGAKVQTYLLEKVRLGFHASGERNYHIFYQLLRGASDEQKKRYDFHDADTHGIELSNFYHYTGQGGAPALREFSDEDGLKYTLKAMRSLGWDDAKIDTVLSLCAGLLHLGQVNFDSVENEGGQEVAVISDMKGLKSAATLLGVDAEMLKTALTERILVTRGEEITIQLSPEKAVDSRDALTKTVYGALFLWIVSEVNKSIIWSNENEVKSSIGVLDIFGFECFNVNSFEQLCINFTNEALQQQFNKFIFKMEQAEYEREKIQWDFISFPDNQDCLDTIQSRPNGILSMLDDECRLGARGNDRNWADRLYQHYIPNKNQIESENTRFSATPIEKSKAIFTVRHFAGPVKYTATTGFLEKNKDEIPVTAHNLFDSAQSWLIKESYSVLKQETEEQTSSKTKTVGQQFKEQLTQLMEKVESTEPHYIRCLKPNDAAKPNMLTRRRLTEQLRYGGVLEAVRVARMGFPVRLNHELFYQTYRMLLPAVPEEKLPWNLEGKDAQKMCVMLVEILLDEGKKSHKAGAKDAQEEGISRSEKIRRMQRQPIPMVFPNTDVQLGLTKVFMRKPAHDALEAHRVFHQNAAVTILQAWIRGLQKRVKHLVLLQSVLTVQRFYRGCKGRERWWRLREAVAADLLTKNFRMLVVQRRFLKAKNGTVLFQGLFRGYAARRVFAATKIQSQYRMRKDHYKFIEMKKGAIALQCRHRIRVAKKVLAALKFEQKDIGKLKANNAQLKQEMASLKAMLAAEAKGKSEKEEVERELRKKEAEIMKLEKRIVELESELEKEKENMKKLEKKLEKEIKNSSKREDEISALREQNKNLQNSAPPPPPPTRSSSIGSPQSTKSHFSEREIDNEEFLQQKERIMRLEKELDIERNSRKEADGEVIRLRAAINGVKLDESMIQSLIPAGDDLSKPSAEEQTTESQITFESEASFEEPEPQDSLSTPPKISGSLAAITQKGNNDEKKSMRDYLRSPSDYFPMIRRGHLAEEDKKEVGMMGWGIEVTSRKEREELLRDNAHAFELNLRKFGAVVEQGFEVSMWQLNKNVDLSPDNGDEFTVKGSSVQVQLHRNGDFLVQAALTFTMKGGYFAKALNRRRVDHSALEPLSVTEILDVKAGCDGFDPSQLPLTSRKSKKDENKHGSLFITIKAAPTPLASTRLYFWKFKSRKARNDVLYGIRGLLGDLQIKEGVSISIIQTPTLGGGHVAQSPMRLRPGDNLENGQYNAILPQNADQIMVPLSEVHKAIDAERQAYDKLLLLLLQGSSDLKRSEDDMLMLRATLDAVIDESREKDKIQENDSKLIMQLSKKLETLLMDNEDLRDQNESLNQRLVAIGQSKYEYEA